MAETSHNAVNSTERVEATLTTLEKRAVVTKLIHLLPWLLFVLFTFRELELPGIYMDEINHAAFAPAIVDAAAADKPHYRLPDNIFGNQSRFPILGGSVYNSVIGSYLATPLYKLWGFTVASQRLWEIIMCAALLALFQLLALRLFQQPAVVCAITSCLAVDPLFTFQPRSNAHYFVLMLVGVFGFLLVLHACWRRGVMSRRAAICGAISTGLALSTYWVAGAVLIGPFVALAYVARRNRVALMLLIGTTAILMAPYVYALISIYIQAPSQLANWGMPQFALNAQHRAPLSIVAKLVSAVNEDYNYLGTTLPFSFIGVSQLCGAPWKAIVLLSATCVMLADVVHRCWRGGSEKTRASFIIVALGAPLISFFILLTQFASITFHHLLATLPFVYLALAYVCDRVWRMLGRLDSRLRLILCLTAPSLLLVLSLIQQQQVIGALRRSGGVGVFNERISQVPLLSSQLYPGAYVVFPDWGFHLTFLFLTAGKVPYATPSGEPNVWMRRLLEQRGSLVICALPGRTDVLAAAARQAGAATEVRPVTGRDGGLIFNFIHATIGPPAPARSSEPAPAQSQGTAPPMSQPG